MAEFSEITVNAEYLANKFSVTMRTIQLWAQNDGLPKNSRDEYPLIPVLEWMLARKDLELKKALEEDPEKLERAEAIKLQNERRRIELQKLNNDLLDRELVEQVNITFAKMISRNIDAVAPRLNKKLGGDATMLATIKQDLDELKTICASTQLNYFEEELQTSEE